MRGSRTAGSSPSTCAAATPSARWCVRPLSRSRRGEREGTPYGVVRQKPIRRRIYNRRMGSGSLEFTVSPSANPATDAERESILQDPGFGKHPTDHMVSIEYTDGRGWHDAQVLPYGPIQLDPSAIVLHYAQE